MKPRRVPFPHEHGAWAMLTAAVILAWAHPWARGWPAAVLTLLFVVCFAIQEPLRAVAGGRREPVWWGWIALYGGLLLAGAAYLVLIHETYAVLPAALLGAVLTAADLYLRRRKRHRSFLLRLFGAAGLTLALPAILVFYHPGRTAYAFVLWLHTVAYFTTRLLAVRARNEHRRRSPDAPAWRRASLWAQGGLYALLGGLVLGGYATAFIVLAYLPGSVAVLRASGTRADIRTVGWREMAHLAWFVAALLGSYHLGRLPALEAKW